jgi:lipoate synthase
MTVRHPEKVNNIENPIQKKPAWIRVKASYSKEYTETKNILKKTTFLQFAKKLPALILMNAGVKNMQHL